MEYQLDAEIERFSEVSRFLKVSIQLARAMKNLDTPDEIDDDEGERLAQEFMDAYTAMMETGDGVGIVGGSGEAAAGADQQDGS